MLQGKHNTVHKYGGQKRQRSIIVYNVCLTCNTWSKILALSLDAFFSKQIFYIFPMKF